MREEQLTQHFINSKFSYWGELVAIAFSFFVYAVLFYLPLSSALLLIITLIFIVFLVWPNRAMLLIMPSLLPLLNLELGIGEISLLRVALIGCFLGFLLRKSLPMLTKEPIIFVAVAWTMFILGLVVSAIANDLIGEMDTWKAISVFVSRGVLFMLMVLAWTEDRSYRDFAFGWAIFGLLTLSAALYLLSQGGSVVTIRGGLDVAAGSIDGVVGLCLAVSSFSVNSLLAFISLSFLAKQKFLIYFLYGSALTMLFPIFMSGRRQAILGLGISVFLWLVLSWKDRVVFRHSLVLLLIGFVISISSGLATDFFSSRESILQELAGEGTGRRDIYLGGIEGFMESPIFGNGPGTYRETLGVVLGWDKSNASHNTIIGVAAEAGMSGLFGLSILLAGVTSSWWRLIIMSSFNDRNQSGDLHRRALYTTAGVAIAGLLVSNILEHQGYLLTIAPWIGMLALEFGALQKSSEESLVVPVDDRRS